MHKGLLLVLGLTLAALTGMTSRAAHQPHLVDGITGTAFTLTAREGHISGPEGNNIYIWGLADGAALKPQYPSPTIILNQGQTVTITLVNQLPPKYNMPVSLVFPGQVNVTSVGGSQDGPLAREAINGGPPVTYTFTASQPGTYLYNSGSRPDLQIELGIVGAIIVRPTGFDPGTPATWKAYNDTAPAGQRADSGFDTEFLFLLTEMDDAVHTLVEQNRMAELDMSKWWPVYWFINGRAAPDTMSPANASYLPTQPYDCMPIFSPGDRVLMRVVGAGRDPHPFHHHGNNSLVIAQDGRLLSSAGSTRADLAYSVFTIPSHPGETTDAIFTWTGEKLGWDVYGHNPGDALAENEYAPDHGKPFPVRLPTDQQVTFGQMYSGTPFLGSAGILPPGEGGFNPSGGLMYMWHSHNEKEICNNNIFPGGMLTLVVIEAH